MQKLSLNQSLQQKLSPQQIQFIKLLQIPTAELRTRILEELEINPTLEEGKDEIEKDELMGNDDNDDDNYEDDNQPDEVNIDDYLQDDDFSGYKMQGDSGGQEEDKEMHIPMATTLMDALERQLGFLKLSDRQMDIGKQLVGSIDEDGYIRRELKAIVNDLAFSQNIEASTEEVEEILYKIQRFDPAGIGARDLQECLLLQLERKIEEEHEIEEHIYIQKAIEVVTHHFEEFTKKHYEKIKKKIDATDDDLKYIINQIIKLNPKPGDTFGNFAGSQYVIPDFILNNNNGKLEISLNSKNAPELRISRSYAEMLDTYDKSNKKDKSIKETVTFVKQKLDAAKWFIDAIKQRQQTLLRTMQAILEYQHEFFLEGDESKFKPMILKDIAERIDMDISTVSRVANSKSIQTDFGVYPLKYFFSEGIATDTGEDVSSREVKAKLKEYVDNEDKRKPLSDDKLEKMLNDAGYKIARRTVAKYREQLNIPVARLRKEL